MAKKAKAKKSVKGNRAAAALPAGFTAIAVGGGFGAWHDFHKQKTLIGKVVGTDSYMAEDDETGKKKQRRILRVDTGNGVVVSVGESHTLKELFDTKGLKGRTVYIQFLGQKSFKNKKGKTRKVNEFAVGYK